MLQSRQNDIGKLTIIGPDTMPELMDRLYSFLFLDRHFLDCGRPTLVTVAPGDKYETEDAVFTVGSCYHPVSARCYRMESKIDGKCLAFTGDTAYNENMIPLFKGANAVIHDCTLGVYPMNDDPKTRACGHSTIYEGIKLCEQAGIPLLFPMHMNDSDAFYAIEQAQPTTKVVIKFPSQKEDFILY
jgi:hypothetical protein